MMGFGLMSQDAKGMSFMRKAAWDATFGLGLQKIRIEADDSLWKMDGYITEMSVTSNGMYDPPKFLVGFMAQQPCVFKFTGAAKRRKKK